VAGVGSVNYLKFFKTVIRLAFDENIGLADYPDIGHLRDNLTDKPVKFWTFKWHYLIIYKPISPVEVVRVLSGYRDIANLIS
jgi:plasmid stabilization system protein ParE